jgi:hypothetical protein
MEAKPLTKEDELRRKNLNEIGKHTRFTKGVDPKRATMVQDLKKKDLRKMIEAELSKNINGVTRAEGLVARLITMGIQGNMRAIELILAYLYGKPQNQVIEADNKPFVLELTEPEKESVKTLSDNYPIITQDPNNEADSKTNVSV